MNPPTYMNPKGFQKLLHDIPVLPRGEFITILGIELYPHQSRQLDKLKGFTILSGRENSDKMVFYCIGHDADRELMFKKIKLVLADIGADMSEIERVQ